MRHTYFDYLSNKDNLLWVDLEMTGLNPETEKIMSMAFILTNDDLEILAEGPELHIHVDEETLSNMDEWCVKTHGESGLTQRCRESKLTLEDAEKRMVELLSQWVGDTKPPMCGNSVHMDRLFLAKYMPKVEAMFHYRNVDVSTIKELAKRWRFLLAEGYSKKGAHTALADIKESIDELRYYRDNFFNV